jgi:hypothetical protein
MEKLKNAHYVLVGTLEGKRPLAKPMNRWKNISIEEIWGSSVNRICPDQLWTSVNRICPDQLWTSVDRICPDQLWTSGSFFYV